MECMSCQKEIDPKWTHAIEANICPFCGQSILEEVLKNCFSDLRKVMEQLQKYPKELDDWMLSNFNYIKTSAMNISLNQSKKMIQNSINHIEDIKDIEVVKPLTDDQTNSFFQRAGVVGKNENISEKMARLKATVASLENKSTNILQDVEGMDEVSAARMLLEQDASENFDEESEEIYHNDDLQEEAIPASVLAFANKGQSGGANNDMHKLRQLRQRQLESRKNFKNGDNRGKGGFSRA